MGYGHWTRTDFISYNVSKGRTVTASGTLDARLTDRQIFTQIGLHPRLNPRNVLRECCDSEEHPETVPVILALDVTGSMGPASAEVAKKMNEVMTALCGRIKDVEFMVMGIGDLAYDKVPIQISQFESDIRIAEQLDLIYMEHGGGGNEYESYTAAWYMGLNHTKLDCWKRGKKGLIITMGDETLNPYLPKEPLSLATGDPLQSDVETEILYQEASEKFEIYHIFVNHPPMSRFRDAARDTFGKLLPEGHLQESTVVGISSKLTKIISDFAQNGEKQRNVISWQTGDKPDESRKGIHRIFSW